MRKQLKPATLLVATGGLAGMVAGGVFSQTPDIGQAMKLGLAGGLLGVAAGGIAAAFTQKGAAAYGLVGGAALLIGGWLASQTRTEILSGGAGLTGLTPAIQYYAPILG